MRSRKHPFYRVASLVTAADLQCSFAGNLEATADARESVIDCMQDESGRWVDGMYLVFDQGEIVGCWATHFYDGDMPQTIADTMDRLSPSMLVSANTTFFDLADAFAAQQNFYLIVLDGAEFTGWVSFLDLFSRTGQLCILSLTFLLEAVAQDLCLYEAQRCWDALPTGRKDRAKEAAARRFTNRVGVEQPSCDSDFGYLVRSTMFIDKSTMLIRANLLPSPPADTIKTVFETAERVRNLCSHGADEQELNRTINFDHFPEFLHGTQNLVEAIRRRLRELEDA